MSEGTRNASNGDDIVYSVALSCRTQLSIRYRRSGFCFIRLTKSLLRLAFDPNVGRKHFIASRYSIARTVSYPVIHSTTPTIIHHPQPGTQTFLCSHWPRTKVKMLLIPCNLSVANERNFFAMSIWSNGWQISLRVADKQRIRNEVEDTETDQYNLVVHLWTSRVDITASKLSSRPPTITCSFTSIWEWVGELW